MMNQNQQGLSLPIDHKTPMSMCKAAEHRNIGIGEMPKQPNCSYPLYSAAHYFAALKLIEQLYKDGHISAQTLRNILRKYADVVDLSKFTIMEEKEDAV